MAAGRPEATPARAATTLSAGAGADVVVDVTAEHEPTAQPSTMRPPSAGGSHDEQATGGGARNDAAGGGRARSGELDPARQRKAAPPHQPPASSSGHAGGDGDRSKRRGGGRRGQSLGTMGRRGGSYENSCEHHTMPGGWTGRGRRGEAGSGRRARRG
jgi:hypothetical protein